MNYKVEKKYLVLPISDSAKLKKVCFYDKDERCVFDIDIRLDYKTSTREVYVDMERYIGEELKVEVIPEMKLEIKEKERKPVERFKQKLRPKYHFTPAEGWMNDPNGLVYADGLYHMFYQLNPVENKWGNMHWGHAVSKNLLDWEYRPIALFPGTEGTIFSGSAIADTDNIIGLRNSERTPLVLYYTAAGNRNKASQGKPFTQCMAISLDGGEGFAKYAGNPIIPHIASENRDPKVVYSEKLKCFVMSLYIENDNFKVFTSKNLTEWDEVCSVNIPYDNECPAFFPLLNGKGEEKWIFMGAHDRYIVGSFDGTCFKPDHEGSKLFNCTGRNSYAAQKFENTADRCIRIAWLTQDFSKYGEAYNSAMSVPQELRLITENGSDILTVSPCRELAKLRRKKEKILHTGRTYSCELSDVAIDIELTIERHLANKAELCFFGLKFDIDFENGIFSDSGENARFVPDADGKFNMRLLCDTCGVEAYLSDGKYYGFFKEEVPDENLCTFNISADSDIKVKGNIFRLRPSRKSDRRK